MKPFKNAKEIIVYLISETILRFDDDDDDNNSYILHEMKLLFCRFVRNSFQLSVFFFLLGT